jgi:hypothetical protein
MDPLKLWKPETKQPMTGGGRSIWVWPMNI